MRFLECTRMGSFVAACALAATFGCTRDAPNPSAAQAISAVEAEQSAIRLLDLDGNPFDLWRQAKGEITVVVFTRTDCPVSNRFAPEICQLYETYQSRGVDFYLVYVDPREGPESIRHHLQEYGYPCRGLRDPAHTLVAYCRATTTPEAAVFDRDRTMTYLGRVNNLYQELGKSRAQPTTHDLADAIESTILGRPVATPRAKAIGCPIADLGN